MSNAQTRLESIRPSLREELRHLSELIGNDAEPTQDFRVWNDASQRLHRATAAFEALNDVRLVQLGKACQEFTHLLASQAFTHPSEACERLLACLQVLSEHTQAVSSISPNPRWHRDLLTALAVADSASSAAIAETDAAGRQAAAAAHIADYRDALLAWLTGQKTEQAMTQLARILHTLKPAMHDTPVAKLAILAEALRSHQTSFDGYARQCLSRGERLLQQIANGEDYSARADELEQKLAPLLAGLPAEEIGSVTVDTEAINQGDYWRPHCPAPADRDAWTGLAAALRDDLHYVIESLDITSRTTPAQAPDMRIVAERLQVAAHVLIATNLSDWAEQLNQLAAEVAAGPARADCLQIAEQIQDVMACLRPEVIEQRLAAASNQPISTDDAVVELSRTAVIDAALGSIARLSARFEILATSDYRPAGVRPTEEIDTLWGAARVLDWNSLSDATAWLRDCANAYLEQESNQKPHQQLSNLLTGCVVVERFLQTVRLPWPDRAAAEAEMQQALQQLAPLQFTTVKP